jgi:uncharacterized integral membrane protein (TIGR00697 family)
MNELIFILYIFVVAAATLAAAWFSREALIALLCLQTVLMNLFVAKEITLFGLTATASDALGVGGALCLNLLQEFYGVSMARRAIWLSFFCTLYYLLLSLLHCAYTPGCGDTSNVHFLALLLPMPRIIIVSLISYFIAQTADRRLYGLLNRWLAGRFFLVRNYASIALTQLLDTILFTVGALWGVVSSPTEVIMVSYAIKLAVLLLATPFLLLAKKLLAQHLVKHV